jgi:penicillin-binding protein-related factor A (putative recombinase)
MGVTQKAFGNLFEDLFEMNCRRIPDMALTRFPDGCRIVGQNKIVRIKTPCDWVLSYKGGSALIDTKTTETNSFPHSKICPHQVNEMAMHSRAGAKSGYVVWFRESDEVYYLPSLYMNDLKDVRGSVKHYQAPQRNYLGKSGQFDPRIIFTMN